MHILVACESSGRVREAFRRRGHDAISVDLVASELPGQHIIGDVRSVLYSNQFDMMIAFPPCTYLSYAGARWFNQAGRAARTELAIDFVRELLNAPIERIALENPRGIIATRIRKPDDVIEPYMFGDPFKKRTYLWLKNLPPLMSTMRMMDYQKNWTESQNKNRAVTRSRTFNGLAEAMAAQWG